jgi:UDP:flavonoid glycosyltransferase YjiC (YdhE family)
MARILIIITGQAGVTNASLELSRRLTAVGHHVTLAAPRDRAEEASAAGIDFLLLPTINENPEKTILRLEGPLPKAGGARKEAIVERRLAAKVLTQPFVFEPTLDELRPELMIVEVELHEYILEAWGAGQNMILLSQWYSLWDRPGLPYQLVDTIPGRGWRGSKLAMWLHWKKTGFGRMRMHRKRARRFHGTERRSALLALAEEVGFPRKYIRKSFWPGAFTYEGLPVMAMAPLEMEFPHTPPPWLQYVGPMVLATRPEGRKRSLNGFSLEAIYALREERNAKLILCTVSTMQAAKGDFLYKLIEAARGQEEWMLLIGLGGKVPTGGLPELPDNVYPFRHVPQLEVLGKADLSINHAGIHTIHECLYFGVPQLVYSGKKSDQPGCAARVQYHGVGLMADKDVDSAETIRSKIDRVLREPAYREATLAMREKLGHYREQQVAENMVAQALEKERKHD